MKFDGKAFGEEVVAVTRAFVAKELAPLLARLDAAEKRVAELEALPKAATAEEIAALIPAPKDGKDGADGSPGRDGVDGAPGEKGLDGKDGTNGIPGEKGLDGAPGLDGKDGLSVAGILKDHEGWLVFTLADGTMQKIAHVDGKDGKDGAPGRDVDMEFVRTVVQDEVQKQVNAPMATAYKGVWKDGTEYKNGSVITWGGSLWLSKADTFAKPEKTNDWVLIVKHGRDGKDGKDGGAPKPLPKLTLT
jgi:integrin beta 3